MLNSGRFLAFSVLVVLAAGCHKHNQANETTNVGAKAPAELFDLTTSSVDDYKAAVTKFQQGEGPMPVLSLGQVSIPAGSEITILGTVPPPPLAASGLEMRDAPKNDTPPGPRTADEAQKAINGCQVCNGQGTPTPPIPNSPSPTVSPTATPGESSSPSPSVTPTASPSPTTTAVASPTDGAKSTSAVARNGVRRFAFGRCVLGGCPIGFFPTFFYFVGADGTFFIASVCSDGVPPSVCRVSYANGNVCQYNYFGVGNPRPATYSCLLPPVGISAVTGILCF